MHKAAIIFNPMAGRQRHLRAERIQAAVDALRNAGIVATLLPTASAGHGCEVCVQAIADGHDLIIAAGGDGTLHDVLQGVMQSPKHADIPIGVLPLGTGNVVANDLGLPRGPRAAIEAQLKWKPRRITAGKLDYAGGQGPASRYFVAVTGIGPDAEFIAGVSSESKGRYGMLAYLVQGAIMTWRHNFPLFNVTYTDSETGNEETAQVSQLMAVRITNFGNFVRRIAPGAALDRDDFQLVLFKTRSVHKYNLYLLRALSGIHYRVPGVDLAYAREVRVTPLEVPIRCEADGEALGSIPARITAVPDAFTLLMPEKQFPVSSS